MGLPGSWSPLLALGLALGAGCDVVVGASHPADQGGSVEGRCPAPPSCNWCGGTAQRDGRGCVVGYRCANGVDPCATSPCETAGCETGQACRADHLCWTCGAEVCNGLDDDCDGVVDNGAPCPVGERCVQGGCVVSPRPCITSADCAVAGQSCVAGRCSPAQCGGAADCEAGQSCVGSYCTPKDCATDQQCGMTQRCVGGGCSPSECSSDADCSGLLCLGGSCPRRCSGAADCASGESCVSGYCR